MRQTDKQPRVLGVGPVSWYLLSAENAEFRDCTPRPVHSFLHPFSRLSACRHQALGRCWLGKTWQFPPCRETSTVCLPNCRSVAL